MRCERVLWDLDTSNTIECPNEATHIDRETLVLRCETHCGRPWNFHKLTSEAGKATLAERVKRRLKKA